VALKEVSDLCRSHLRDIDIIGRLGGEEFVIILPDTSMDAAVIVANRLRLAIENTKIVFKENIFRLTVTIGVAGLTQKDRDIDSLVHRADAALYKGKQAGRNRVEVSGPVQADMI
jgi:diguanylate cyclase (GGDEF)-like protein